MEQETGARSLRETRADADPKLAEFRAFLDDVRIRASNKLTQEIADDCSQSLKYGELPDPADVHEDVRETLWPFFNEIRLRIEGPECPERIEIGTNAFSSCQLPAGHEGRFLPW